ncbi:MAG: hypothetical protein ACOY3P_16035 [Planctomycetota bacterium]
MNELLQEYAAWGPAAMGVDRNAGVLRGAKVLGLVSRNGRSYLPDALREAAALYEDAKVNVNHPSGDPARPRDYRDRIGTLRGVVWRPGEGLFADFHFNPKHPLAEQLAWDAEHAPHNVGFSHNVWARTARRGEQVVVEAITRVQSVDLVADPATTRGLFEAGAPSGAAAQSELLLAEATLEDLARSRPELVAACRAGAENDLDQLRTQLAENQAELARQRRENLVLRLLHEHGLPGPANDGGDTTAVVSRAFVESLLAAPGEAEVRALVEERARLVTALGGAATHVLPAVPQARAQYAATPLCGKSFAAAIGVERQA